MHGRTAGTALAVLAASAGLVLAGGAAHAATTPGFVQAISFTTGTRVASTSVTLAHPVVAGDLLVAWVSQYNVTGRVTVRDPVDGAWTRTSAVTTFSGGSGDIALFVVVAAVASPSLTITVSAPANAYFTGSVAEYTGLAAASPIVTTAVGRGSGTAARTPSTSSVAAGQTVFSALVTGGNPRAVTAGTGYTARSTTASGNGFAEDLSAAPAGSQTGSATLAAATDWYDVVAVLRPAGGDTQAPTVPTNLQQTGSTTSSVSLAWSASTDDTGVVGYTVYQDGTAVATPTGVTYTDPGLPSGSSYTYTVDAVDAAGNHSGRSAPATATVATGSGAPPTWRGGAASATSSRVPSTSVTLPGSVGAGDLLVGWFAEYNVAGKVAVSDSVNGAWTRAPAATAYQNDTGDIALYYLANAKAAPSGAVVVTVSAGGAAYLSAVIDDYSGVALGGPLDSAVVNRDVSATMSVGPTAAAPAGELVFSAMVTGGSPGSVAAGSSAGAPFTARAATASGSVFSEDLISGGSGGVPQTGTATLAASTDWYAVVATFRPAPTGDVQPPSVPSGLRTTMVSSAAVSIAWNPSTDDNRVAGYTISRNGAPLTTVFAPVTSYTDSTVVHGTSYSYTVDAFDGAANHSAPSAALSVAVPQTSPAYVQGVADSPGTRQASTTVTLANPVTAGDLLVAWVAQYDAPGQVTVTDPVNGAWTRAPLAETFVYNTGDIALYYVPRSAASTGPLTVTISASGPTYLPSAVSEYSGVATTSPLDQGAVGRGVGTLADSGGTAAVGTGELVVGALLTGGQPLSVTPGSSQGAPFQVNAFNGSRSADTAAIYSSNPGPQQATFTLGISMDWYALVATFRAAA